MSSGAYMIDCANCGSVYGFENYDYSENIKTTDCVDCDYEKIETFEKTQIITKL